MPPDQCRQVEVAQHGIPHRFVDCIRDLPGIGHMAQRYLHAMLSQVALYQQYVGRIVFDQQQVQLHRAALPLLGWFVGGKPINTQSGDRLGKLAEVQRFAHEAVRTVAVARNPVALLVSRGQDDHRQQSRAFVCAQPLEHLEASYARQVEVEHHHRWQRLPGTESEFAFGEQEIQRLLTIAHDVDMVGQMHLAQRAQGQHLVLRIIFDEQYGSGFHASSSSAKATRGREKLNVAPAPRTPIARRRPPCRLTMRCTVARPMPSPGNSSCRCNR